MKRRKMTQQPQTPAWSGACNFGMHSACEGASYEAGKPGDFHVRLACECPCHGPQPAKVKDTMRWRRDPVTGKRYLSGYRA